jgi:hypothetical protein
VGGRAVPQYLLYVGGGVSSKGARFGRLVTKIPARRAPAVLDRLVALYRRARLESEEPDAFFARVDVDIVKSLIADLAELDSASAREDDFIDLGESTAFSVQTQAGECAA